jgi:hypothetical protein
MLDLDFTNESICNFEINQYDQFKVRIIVNRSDSNLFDKWKKDIKDYITEKGGLLVSIELKLKEEKSRIALKRKFKNISPEIVFKRFVSAEGLDDYYANVGREFL